MQGSLTLDLVSQLTQPITHACVTCLMVRIDSDPLEVHVHPQRSKWAKHEALLVLFLLKTSPGVGQRHVSGYMRPLPSMQDSIRGLMMVLRLT